MNKEQLERLDAQLKINNDRWEADMKQPAAVKPATRSFQLVMVDKVVANPQCRDSVLAGLRRIQGSLEQLVKHGDDKQADKASALLSDVEGAEDAIQALALPNVPEVEYLKDLARLVLGVNLDFTANCDATKLEFTTPFARSLAELQDLSDALDTDDVKVMPGDESSTLVQVRGIKASLKRRFR